MDPTTTKNFENQSAGQRILAIDLPAPEETEDYAALPDTPPHAELTFVSSASSNLERRVTMPKSLFKGALDGSWRFIRGIPACVWVVNMHKEEITVLVSKYGPNRQLSGGGINASATGGGLNINTTVRQNKTRKREVTPAHGALWACPIINESRSITASSDLR